MTEYLLAFAVLFTLACILWTSSCISLRRAKRRTISQLQNFAKQVNALYSYSLLLDYDKAKGVHRQRSFEYKLYERRGAWLSLAILLKKPIDFYLRIARKSLKESIIKGRKINLEKGDLLPFLEDTLVIKTSDSKTAQNLLDSNAQAIVLRLFEDFKIAKLEIDSEVLKINISDPEIAGEKYFSALLDVAIEFADAVETKASA
jgi:hypothetical protein